MAQQELLNNESRLSFRTKLNNMFTEMYTYISSIGTTLSGHTSSITALQTVDSSFNTRITTNESAITAVQADVAILDSVGATSVAATAPLAPVTVGVTPALLTYFNAIVMQSGTFTTASIPAQTITIGATGYYKIYGGVIVEFPSPNILTLRLYNNGVPLTPSFSQQGLGAGKPINIHYSTIVYLTAGDVLTLYASADASISITVDGASVNYEKTHF